MGFAFGAFCFNCSICFYCCGIGLLIVKRIIKSELLDLAGIETALIGCPCQFVVEVTDGPLVLFYIGVYPVNGIIALLVVHHEQVVFHDGVQDG